MKKTLEKRLVYLYSGELCSIFIFVAVSYLLNYAFPSLQLYSLYSFWVSFIFLEFLLLQGTAYWYVKLKRLRKENTPFNVITYFPQLKRVNLVIIMCAIVFFAIDFIIWYPSLPLAGLMIVLIIYIFAILEFINYFYLQLSYDHVSDIKSLFKNKRLKKSCMNKEFERIKK